VLIPILLIDRKIERRQMLAAQLSAFAEFQVTQTNDAECSKIAGYDVALIMHKPVDAFEIAHRLHNAQTNISTILLAADGSEALAVRAWRQGFGDYLAYPCDVQDVYDSIMRVMDHRIQDRITAETQRQLLAANLELTHYLQGLDKIVEVGKAITADLLLEDVLTTVVQAAAAVMQSDTASILLKDDVTGDLFARAA
jgi:FixJ family two-component response regulator